MEVCSISVLFRAPTSTSAFELHRIAKLGKRDRPGSGASVPWQAGADILDLGRWPWRSWGSQCRNSPTGKDSPSLLIDSSINSSSLASPTFAPIYLPIPHTCDTDGCRQPARGRDPRHHPLPGTVSTSSRPDSTPVAPTPASPIRLSSFCGNAVYKISHHTLLCSLPLKRRRRAVKELEVRRAQDAAVWRREDCPAEAGAAVRSARAR